MSNKFQNVSFKSVEEFLEYLPKDEYVIVQHLRQMIFSCVPQVQEKISYNVPFYRINKMMFFIWPASVSWGKKKNKTGVEFGFCQGYLLRDELNYLEKGTRKQVYMKTFQNLNEIDEGVMRAYLFEALDIDAM